MNCAACSKEVGAQYLLPHDDRIWCGEECRNTAIVSFPAPVPPPLKIFAIRGTLVKQARWVCGFEYEVTYEDETGRPVVIEEK